MISKPHVQITSLPMNVSPQSIFLLNIREKMQCDCDVRLFFFFFFLPETGTGSLVAVYELRLQHQPSKTYIAIREALKIAIWYADLD